jgi:hypothetical protein
MVVCLSSDYFLNCRVASTIATKTLIFSGNRTYSSTGKDRYQSMYLALNTGEKELLLVAPVLNNNFNTIGQQVQLYRDCTHNKNYTTSSNS